MPTKPTRWRKAKVPEAGTRWDSGVPVSVTLLPIPSGTWSRIVDPVPVDVLSIWLADDGFPKALIRYSNGEMDVWPVRNLRLTVPDRAKTLEDVLADVAVVRDMLVYADAGSTASRAYRELSRIIEDARAGQ